MLIPSDALGTGIGAYHSVVKILFDELVFQICVGWVFPEVVKFIGVFSKIVEFAIVFVVVNDEFVAVVAQHGRPTGFVFFRGVWGKFIDDIVVFTAHKVVVRVPGMFARENGDERFAVCPFERDAGEVGQGGRNV